MPREPHLSRRDALKAVAGSVTVAGAAAAPYFVPASALGNAGQVAASERLGLGFIGRAGRAV